MVLCFALFSNGRKQTKDSEKKEQVRQAAAAASRTWATRAEHPGQSIQDLGHQGRASRAEHPGQSIQDLGHQGRASRAEHPEQSTSSSIQDLGHQGRASTICHTASSQRPGRRGAARWPEQWFCSGDVYLNQLWSLRTGEMPEHHLQRF